MQLGSTAECRAYVEAELDRVVRSRPGWRAAPATVAEYPETATDPPALVWMIRPPEAELWYTLQADLGGCEFLIWFGNHRVGLQGLHWIMRPAVHVSFRDLWPREDPLRWRWRLGDVLTEMIESLSEPQGFATRFDLNTFSAT